MSIFLSRHICAGAPPGLLPVSIPFPIPLPFLAVNVSLSLPIPVLVCAGVWQPIPATSVSVWKPVTWPIPVPVPVPFPVPVPVPVSASMSISVPASYSIPVPISGASRITVSLPISGRRLISWHQHSCRDLPPEAVLSSRLPSKWPLELMPDAVLHYFSARPANWPSAVAARLLILDCSLRTNRISLSRRMSKCLTCRMHSALEVARAGRVATTSSTCSEAFASVHLKYAGCNTTHPRSPTGRLEGLPLLQARLRHGCSHAEVDALFGHAREERVLRLRRQAGAESATGQRGARLPGRGVERTPSRGGWGGPGGTPGGGSSGRWAPRRAQTSPTPGPAVAVAAMAGRWRRAGGWGAPGPPSATRPPRLCVCGGASPGLFTVFLLQPGQWTQAWHARGQYIYARAPPSAAAKWRRHRWPEQWCSLYRFSHVHVNERCKNRLKPFHYACDELSQVPELWRATNRRFFRPFVWTPFWYGSWNESAKDFLNAVPISSIGATDGRTRH